MTASRWPSLQDIELGLVANSKRLYMMVCAKIAATRFVPFADKNQHLHFSS